MSDTCDPREDYRPDGAREFFAHLSERQEAWGNAWAEVLQLMLTHTDVPPALAGPNA